ncbi:MAG: hypothetical protein VX438_05185, partial [Planctomycetota bacterium]|nr:hypothetical protein [Planctomycetota bacterium]
GTIPPSTVTNQLTTTMDLHPTFAHLAGAKMPSDRVIDGKNIAPILLGKNQPQTPHDRFFYQKGGKVAAVRSGSWKLFITGELYNLDRDIGEKTNVATEHPKIVKKLNGLFEEFSQDLAENSRPVGFIKNSRTLVPRPGVQGENAYRPTLSIQ